MRITAQNCSGESVTLKILHRTTCILSTLLTVLSLFSCVFRLFIALTAFHEQSAQGFSYSLQFYLRDTYFYFNMVFFLLAAVELVLYVFLCHRVWKKGPVRWGVWYLGGMLVIHAAACIHAYLLPIPRFPVDVADEAKMTYRFFVSLTTLQSIPYFILYLMRVRKFTSKEKSENGSPKGNDSVVP